MVRMAASMMQRKIVQLIQIGSVARTVDVDVKENIINITTAVKNAKK